VATILVVEDTPSIREIVCFLVRGKGHEVFEAGDGIEGERVARRERPDLIVLDAMLPGRTGFDVCASLKAEPEFRKIPILILTAMTRDSGQSDEEWRARSGADGFMSKPFKGVELLELIQRLLAAGAPPPA
jgi:twitching motility two-component system response regulator PilH